MANTSNTEYASAAIMDVNAAKGGKKEDYVDNFWMGERLEYF